MKPKTFNDNNAQSILKKERKQVFTKSPVTDWLFEKPEESPEMTIVPQTEKDTEIESEFDPYDNQNTEIYGPPEEMGIDGFNDWFKIDL